MKINNNNNNNNLGAMKTPTPAFRPTYPGDSWTNYLMYSNTKYSTCMLQGLGSDDTCEVCPKDATTAVSLQAHRCFNPRNRFECQSMDERKPILLVFTCDDHANAKAFYELTHNKYKSFLVLGTGPAPEHAKWQIMESIIIEELVRYGSRDHKRHHAMRKKITELKKIMNVKSLVKRHESFMESSTDYDDMPRLGTDNRCNNVKSLTKRHENFIVESYTNYDDMPGLEPAIPFDSSDDDDDDEYEYDSSDDDEYEYDSSSDDDDEESSAILPAH